MNKFYMDLYWNQHDIIQNKKKICDNSIKKENAMSAWMWPAGSRLWTPGLS